MTKRELRQRIEKLETESRRLDEGMYLCRLNRQATQSLLDEARGENRGLRETIAYWERLYTLARRECDEIVVDWRGAKEDVDAMHDDIKSRDREIARLEYENERLEILLSEARDPSSSEFVDVHEYLHTEVETS